MRTRIFSKEKKIFDGDIASLLWIPHINEWFEHEGQAYFVIYRKINSQRWTAILRVLSRKEMNQQFGRKTTLGKITLPKIHTRAKRNGDKF